MLTALTIFHSNVYLNALYFKPFFLSCPIFSCFENFNPPLHTHINTVQLSIAIEPAQKVVNVSDRAQLTCTAHAYPLPNIVWARVDSTSLQLQDGVTEVHESKFVNFETDK